MTNFELYWTPANPYDTSLSQQVEYKRDSDSSYTVFDTIAGYKDSYIITGLPQDVLYNFRIASTCGKDVAYTPVVDMVSFSCPDLAITRSDTEIDYSFPTDNSGDISKYAVDLYKNGIFSTKNLYNSPFNTTISDSFTGLDGTSNYSVILSIQVGSIIGTCDPVTGIPVVCVSITGITATSNP